MKWVGNKEGIKGDRATIPAFQPGLDLHDQKFVIEVYIGTNDILRILWGVGWGGVGRGAKVYSDSVWPPFWGFGITLGMISWNLYFVFIC